MQRQHKEHEPTMLPAKQHNRHIVVPLRSSGTGKCIIVVKQAQGHSGGEGGGGGGWGAWGGCYQHMVRGEASVQHSTVVHMGQGVQHCLAILQQGEQGRALSGPPWPPGGMLWGAPAPCLLPARMHDSCEPQHACSPLRDMLCCLIIGR